MNIPFLLLLTAVSIMAADPFEGEWHSSGKDSIGRTFVQKTPGVEKAMGKIGMVFANGKFQWVHDYNKEVEKRDIVNHDIKILDSSDTATVIKITTNGKSDFWIIRKESDTVIEVDTGIMKLVMVKIVQK